ncbi:hypothetical protein Q7P37_010675 [Cladosporium fusiforme]
MASDTQPKTLQQLLDEPKGKTKYKTGQAFMLHVFWETPSLEAAQKLLSALKSCAVATHRDTPCVPSYYFRMSSIEADTVSRRPLTAGEHPKLAKAHQKLQVGVPRAAVVADLVRRDIDTALLDLKPTDALSAHAQLSPVMVECTEVYLDERAFFEHAGSRDYLQAYGEVMAPGLHNKATTVRLGTPTAYIVDKILSPMLKEIAEPLAENCAVWKPVATEGLQTSVLILSINVVGKANEVASKMPQRLIQLSTSFVAFSHPLRAGRTRIMCVLSALPDVEDLRDLAGLHLEAMDVHCEESHLDRVNGLFRSAAPDVPCYVSPLEAGYILHEKAYQLCEEQAG